MTIARVLNPAVFLAAITMGCAGPATAQVCTHDGPVLTCNGGRRGVTPKPHRENASNERLMIPRA